VWVLRVTTPFSTSSALTTRSLSPLHSKDQSVALEGMFIFFAISLGLARRPFTGCPRSHNFSSPPDSGSTEHLKASKYRPPGTRAKALQSQGLRRSRIFNRGGAGLRGVVNFSTSSEVSNECALRKVSQRTGPSAMALSWGNSSVSSVLMGLISPYLFEVFLAAFIQTTFCSDNV